MFFARYNKGYGSIVGSYLYITYGDIIQRLDVSLSNMGNGRHVTLAYWVVNKNFDINELEMDPAHENGPRYCYDITSKKSSTLINGIKYIGDSFNYKYVDTNTIPINNVEECYFHFNKDTDGIKSNKIFVALISTKNQDTLSGLDDFSTHNLLIPGGPGSTYICSDKLSENNKMYADNNFGLIFGEGVIIQPNGGTGTIDSSTNSTPAKIQCTDLRYRTWSDPDGDFEITTNGFYDNYTNGFVDGGNNCNEMPTKYAKLSCLYNNKYEDIITYINNSNNNFQSDFGIPEGRLKDVIFERPDLESYNLEVNNEPTNSLIPRWVFKRSRIKFTIPPAKDKNGKIIDKKITLRYKVVTTIFDKGIYKQDYKIKTYDLDASKKDITLVICPRDEGILDNMQFEVRLSRKYANGGNYSDEVSYKFHTYQKPSVNIAYPKMIRNESTKSESTESESSKNGFKYAKILTSNLYSNFKGESGIVAKHVCDALNVILATPQNDASGIPLFVRFFLAEYKYGRTGLINDSGNPEWPANATVQNLYKSNKAEDYTTLAEITGENNTTLGANKQTAYKTGIYANDGSPILFSGRFTNSTISNIGKEYKLWTYKDWDWVCENTNDNPNADVLVGNPCPITGYEHDNNGNLILDANGNKIEKTLTEKVVGDHEGLATVDSYWSDGSAKTVKKHVSKNILFRAGYIYLLRVRMFHGAAAGAIGMKYGSGSKNSIIYGKINTGNYNYPNDGNYIGDYPIEDKSIYGELKPYNGWVGPADGCSSTVKLVETEKLKQVYPGFSEVDYSIIEPACPYTSISNLITVHPSSPQIGVNQWLSFNYRHLSKNIGAMEMNAYDSTSKTYKNKHFGKTANGIQNTITRIMSMYTSCIETILKSFFNKRGFNGYSESAKYYADLMNLPKCFDSGEVLSPSISEEYISLWLVPINARFNYDANSLYKFAESYPKVSTYKNGNAPIIFNFGLNSRTYIDMTNDDFYTPDSGCYHFNRYRLWLSGAVDENTGELLGSPDFSSANHFNWPEHQTIFRAYTMSQTGSSERYLSLEEPMGNTYRWQPVINAITLEDGNKNIEIQIEGKHDETAKAFIKSDNTIINDNNSVPSEYNVLLYNTAGHDYDLQTKYFYKDEHTITAGGNSFTNNETNRFCIKEFAGVSTYDGAENPGWPAMYTTASTPPNTPYGSQMNTKYFCTALQINDNYGHLYSRVPTTQDCENGYNIKNNLSNIGNISSKGVYTINNDENNVIPITRTTHYLYFKTWINTVFIMKVDVKMKYIDPSSCTDETTEDGETIHKHGDSMVETPLTTFYFDGKDLVTDASAGYDETTPGFWQYPSKQIKFGNSNGFSEVYGEDNYGWGRCLSADDISNRQIKYDGTINNLKTESGGIEVPIMVRYTPLLQPRVLAKYCNDLNTNNSKKWLDISSNNITLERNTNDGKIYAKCVDGSSYSENSYKQIKTEQINLNIAYPFIKESNTYNTVSPNGGNSGNVYYEGYYIDSDTDPTKSVDKLADTVDATNLDFLGGNGICTAYTVLLVPSNPNLPNVDTDEYKNYFTNTDGHWNYYKQPANYYKNGDIYSIRSKTVTNAGPVLVAYNLQPTSSDLNKCDYLNDGIDVTKISDFINDNNTEFKGRNFMTIPINFKDLYDGTIIFENESSKKKFDEFNSITGFNLSTDNRLRTGVIYDLVIVPVYSNKTIHDYNYNSMGDSNTLPGNPGNINDITPGGGVNESKQNIHLAGSNPLVLFNYFQMSDINNVGSVGSNEDTIIPDPDTPDDEPDNSRIHDTDSAIIFPNVDNVKFNIESGEVKECPGFWLNNSFKLILRMPSFRTKSTKIYDSDLITIENKSNGYLDSENGDTPDDFEFEDIQIHIGRINELETEEYGYPNNQDLKLNKLTSKEDLARAHIISYKHYSNAGVFSKKLQDYNTGDNISDEDVREKVTAGSLNPNDEAYAHRFIEVNLSNAKIMDDYGNMVPIYTKYPEGYYIQFRWKSAYASGNEEGVWSDWYGGSYDGGKHWWGANGLNYFVPVRNYTSIYTDFRNYMKESYPGSLINSKIEDNNNNKQVDNNEYKQATVGKGSYMLYGDTNDSSLTNPKESIRPPFYHVGTGNHVDSAVVPTVESINVLESLKNNHSIKLSVNNDSPYFSQYNDSHDTNGPTSGSQFNNHQNYWEMLYIDYIIRNMCKLYYKPDNYNSNDKFDSNLIYHLSAPYNNNKAIVLNYKTWGWDDTEHHILEKSDDIKNYKGSDSIEGEKAKDETSINGERTLGPGVIGGIDDRYKWNRNKYYRRPITKQDFDELNSHLKELVTFIRHELLTGRTNSNEKDEMFGIQDVLPIPPEQLEFNRSRKTIIGNNLNAESGLTNINNINHTMLSSNYIQHIWQQILSVCRPGERVARLDTKTITSLNEN